MQQGDLLKHLKYLWYVLRHKWYVFVECCKLGIPWRGLVHDLSKFKPSEWFPYVDKFYGGKPHSSIADKVKDKRKKAFDQAWLFHQHNNPHHWQYWLLRRDDGSMESLPMPEVYIREMVADWRGAGMAIHGKDECLEWYMNNRSKMHFHQDTQKMVDKLMGVGVIHTEARIV